MSTARTGTTARCDASFLNRKALLPTKIQGKTFNEEVYFYVQVIDAVSPKCLYVNILDEEVKSFSNLNEEMQIELNQNSQKEKYPEVDRKSVV